MKTISAKTKTLQDVNSMLRTMPGDGPMALNNVSHLHGLAAGLKQGEVIVNGSAGDYLAVLNSGATIRVNGDTGSYAADNMTTGTVIIEGNAGFGAAEYCYGGNVIVYGNSGDFTATMNKGATVIVCGSVGDEVGTYMLKGNMVIVGDAGYNLANFLIRGAIYIGGEYQSLGHNTKLVPMTSEDTALLRSLFDTYGIQADPARFRKIVAASEKPFYN